jgi:hypothetical protein
MKYYYVEPEVAGGWGQNTIFDRTPGRPTVVHKLHYEFQGWFGDELLESTPCFIVSERMAQSIEGAHLTGAGFDEVEVTKSEHFRELYPRRQLPRFVWLRVEGKAGLDDFGIAQDARLVVSEKTLGILRELEFSHALVTEFGSMTS